MRPNLRYELHAFLDCSHKSFALKRLHIFMTPEKILSWKQGLPSRLRPKNLNAVFYARFRVTKNILLDDNVKRIRDERWENLRDFLGSIDEEVLKTKFSAALSTNDKLTDEKVYLHSIFGDNSVLKDSFRAREKSLYKTLSSGPRRDTDLWERFIMYNEESLRYCTKRLEPDIARLDTWRSLAKNITKNTAVQTAFALATLQQIESLFNKFH